MSELSQQLRVYRGQWTNQQHIPDPDARPDIEKDRDRLLEKLAISSWRRERASELVQNPLVQDPRLGYEIQNASDYQSWMYGALTAATLLNGQDYADQLRVDAERLASDFPG